VNRLPTTRHSLLLRLSNKGDEAAWSEFLGVYERAIHRFACSLGLQAVDADDVTQRVLAAVLEKSRTWRPDPAQGSFGAWLFRVTRNLSAKTWNASKRAPLEMSESKHDLAVMEVPDPSGEESSLFHLEYRRALFHWAAGRVRGQVQETTWRAFWMTAIEGREPKDVCRELDISASSAYTAKCRVLARIRTEIDAFENELSIRNDGS
jgi:RNA polymerase sigma factor (sigma-70 family)